MGQSRMMGAGDCDDGESRSPRTTIVGGRPPEESSGPPDVPMGIQRLLRLASVDEKFRGEFLERRGDIAQASGVGLTVTERAVLAAIPARQLLGMIMNLPEPAAARRDFLRQTAATAVVLLGGAVLGESLSGCAKSPPDIPPPPPLPGPTETSAPGPFAQPPTDPPVVRPDYNPMQTEGGAAPDIPPPRPTHNPMAPGGVRPDIEPTPVAPTNTRPNRGLNSVMPPDRPSDQDSKK
jgi:hypothetical protein